jgi:hypothetical protein
MTQKHVRPVAGIRGIVKHPDFQASALLCGRYPAVIQRLLGNQFHNSAAIRTPKVSLTSRTSVITTWRRQAHSTCVLGMTGIHWLL